jgi:hypothetical protein
MVFRDDFLLGNRRHLHRLLLNLVRMNDHLLLSLNHHRFHCHRLLLGYLFRGFLDADALARHLSRFLWLRWIDKLVGRLWKQIKLKSCSIVQTFIKLYRILVLITHGNCRHDIENWHSTLLAVTVHEATLSHEVLLAISQQDVIDAVERREDCLVAATLELAGFLWSFEAAGNRKMCVKFRKRE